MYVVIQPLATLKRGACMGLFNPLLHFRAAHVWGYSTHCYTKEGCMYGDIQSLVTVKRVCMYGAIQPLVTLKRGVCMGLFNPLLHLRGVYVLRLFNPLLHLRGVYMYGAIQSLVS